LTGYLDKIRTYKDFPIKGINYLDLNNVYMDQPSRDHLVADCMERIHPLLESFDYFGLIEARGFLLGSILADRLEKGIVQLRSKPGRLPGETKVIKHKLEYGEAQMEVQTGKGKVLIFDDVLATGGTSQGAVDLLKEAGYSPIGALFLIEIRSLKPKLSVDYQSVIKW